MSRKPELHAQRNPLRAIVNYTTPNGGVGSILPDECNSIAETEQGIAAAVLEAKNRGSDIVVRFVSTRTGLSVSRWTVAP